ncbi:CRE-SMG-4 protein [Caenorhabditis remanei]|uniref:CRE-SMG-4 protein n=1 Tax=Caenorhabditis remanei TaxID=31234 RepID=E3MHM6_CAERE|nr:CRE-SMG-4 protein [Caenorhabditis remanei]
MTEDTRVGAILNDKYYLEFCEKLSLEKAVPIMTLEQQIRKLNQPEDARELVKIDRLETPLVKYFIDKEYRRRSEFDVRKAKRELKKAEKHKNVMEFLMKPQAASGAPTTTSSGGSRRLQKASEDFEMKANRVMTEKEKEKLEKIEARRKGRNAIRKQKFLEEKKRKLEETTSAEGIQNPQKKLQKPPVEKIQKASRPPRVEKPPKKSMKPPRPSPAKTVGEQQGEDWIKKLTDPKAPIKKKHDVGVEIFELF